MGDFIVSVAIGLIKVVVYTYDVITYLPYSIFAQRKLKYSLRIKARQTSNNPHAPYRCVQSFDELTTSIHPECNTIDDLLYRSAKIFGPTKCLGTRELLNEEEEMQPNGRVFKKVVMGDYHWLTYSELHSRVDALGLGLLALGQKPKQNILIFAETRADWMITAQACFRYNFPVVTLYSTLGDEAVIHGINEAGVTHVVTSSELLPKFKKILEKMPSVQCLIYMDNGQAVDTNGINESINTIALSAVEELGRHPDNQNVNIVKPTRDDIALIMYTSGSTGLPKGVLISHGNLMCGMSGQCERMPLLNPEDIYIGYLPLAHVLELSAEVSMIGNGGKIGYSSSLTLSDQSSKIKRGTKGDATVLKPTCFAAVPIIMDRIARNVWDKVKEGGKFKRALFSFAYEYKKSCIKRGMDTPIFNKLIFSKIQKLLGGRVKILLSGGAPLSGSTQEFMNICFGCCVLQGYGLTETCGAGTVTCASDFSTGKCGAPLTCNELMLVNWEEGGYRVSDYPNPRGEILVGGGNVCQGYYKNEAKTNEDFKIVNGQRWFVSGDIGEIVEDGCLKLIDRKKDLVKLQAGEYVSLSKVETAISLSPYVDTACVYVDSNKTFPVCLIVPNRKQLAILAKKFDLDPDNIEELCSNKNIEIEILKSIKEQALSEKLQNFEVPMKITLCPEIWTPDTGLVTDAFKLKRRNIQARYQADINRMYA